jgi:GT2 family glycosyltransferase
MRVALEQDYDWIWVFDADSIPQPDALEKLLGLYASWPKDQQDKICFLSCLHINMDDGLPQHGGVFTRYGFTTGKPAPDERYYPCHFNVWSGCLFKIAAVREVGVPNADYVLDWGEGEYGYRIMNAGYKNFVYRDAILYHNVRGYRTIVPVKVKRGSSIVTIYEFSPIRCYYSCRNILYFMLYEVVRARYSMVPRAVLGPARLTLSFFLRPRNHGKHFLACLRGIWHGVTGNIAARY